LNTHAGGPTHLEGAKGAKTVSFSYGAPIPLRCETSRISSGGAGLSFYADETGYLKTNYLKTDLAYRISLPAATLSLGANVGMMQKVIDINGLVYKDPFDPKVPLVSTSKHNVNYGFGISYSSKGKHNVNIGYAIQNVSGRPFSFANVDALAPGLHQYITFDMESMIKRSGIILTTFGLAQMGNQKSIWHDSLTSDRFNFANPTLTMGLLADINPLIQVGMSSRLSTKNLESVSGILGIYLMPNLRLGYAYDMNISSLHFNHRNTHEIILKYCFTKCKIDVTDDPRHIDQFDFEQKHI
jgi:type IX secretion system PorP/SprF family membrane protein